MVLLEADPFLNELHKMYERQKTNGTVWITVKRTNLKPKSKKKPPPAAADCKCLVRASDGKHHISTVISATQQVKFQQSLNVLMKAHMDGLKKREKIKAPKEGK